MGAGKMAADPAARYSGEVPRLTTMLRRFATSYGTDFDIASQYVKRKELLKKARERGGLQQKHRLGTSALATSLFADWDRAPKEAKEVFEQFLRVVSELLGSEPSTEELHQSAGVVFDHLSNAVEEDGTVSRTTLAQKRQGLQSKLGPIPSGPSLSRANDLVAELQQWQAKLRVSVHSGASRLSGSASEAPEFGADFDFKAPESDTRTGNCAAVHNEWWLDDEEEEGLPAAGGTTPADVQRMFAEASAPLPEARQTPAWHSERPAIVQHAGVVPFAPFPSKVMGSSSRDTGAAILTWLRERSVVAASLGAGTQFSGDELALAVCRVLESDQSGDEVAASLFDLIGDGGFELIQELVQHRKGIVEALNSAVSALKEQEAAKQQPHQRMPTYGTQVSVQTGSDKILDKLRRKEARHAKRAGHAESELDWLAGAGGFEALLIAGKDDFLESQMGKGDELTGGINIRALPKGTSRKAYKGYEEVHVPATATAPMHAGERLVPISEMEEFAQLAFEGYKTLNRIQSRIYPTAYGSNENVLVCAPTGAGKTNIAMITVLHEVKQHQEQGVVQKDNFKVVYVAPMKALAAEVTAAFSRRLQPLGLVVKELTGDMQLSKRELEETQMIVTTPEKWDVITRKSSDVALAQLVRLLIIDEVHLLNDERGPVIETLVARTLRQVEATQSMIRIVGLSATLPNYKEVAQFLRVNLETGLFFFDSSYRPIPLEQQYIGVSESNFMARNNLMNDICYRKVLDSVKRGQQAMVFVHSRKDTVKTARILIEIAQHAGETGIFAPETHEQYGLAKKDVSKARGREVDELFQAGFGCHHAGMLRSDRNLVERLFRDGLIKVLVCTATLAWGVNLPAHTVVIKGTQLYDPKAGGFRELSILDVMQIFGRAGRPQFDTSGEGIIITTHNKLAHYLRLMTHQLPIESQFVASLKDNLNAEVVLGTVTNLREASTWLGYTYLYVRMQRNPLAYGMTWEEAAMDPGLVLRRKALITDAARALDKAKMLRFDEKSGNLYVTELGRVASHFYIQYTSVETYNEMLRRHMSESELVHVLAHSSEFENIVVREEELPELETLARKACPLEVKGGPEDKHGKVNILIQCYISRARLDSFSLIADASYISQSVGRIMRALFEICLRRGWCTMALMLLEYAKAVDKRIWPHQHPLRQFEAVLSPEVLHKLEDRNLNLERLVDMEEQEVGALIRHPHGGKAVMQCVGQFPHLSLHASVSPITRTVLRVTLRYTPEFEWKERFHGTADRWWLWVEDSDNEHIYHTEYLTITKKLAHEGTQTLDFTIPIFEPLPSQYYIRVVNDFWLGAQNLLEVPFKNLILPERHPPHTELMDLRPLPLSALQNKAYENLYRFSHFNPIQTQAFHTLYHTDVNVLLGAPTGSGKTISAELAMLWLLNTAPGQKTVYIAPLKALVRERIEDWKRNLVPKLGLKMVELTGDFTPDMRALLSADIIITTPEKWDGISRNWQGRGYVQRVGLMVIDEIHLLGADRGPILEVIVSRMRYISSQTDRPVRFVGLSTALANARDLADWLGIDKVGLFNFKPSVRPVPLEVHIQGYPGKFYCPRMSAMNKPTYAAITTHSPRKPVLVFVSSRRQTRLTALELIQYAAADEKPQQFVNMAEEEVAMVGAQIADPNLKHTLQFGIGMHHAGLSERDRTMVEELFCNNKIQVLVCTSTLAWGVNFPAHLVVIKGTEYFDGKTKRYVDFPITDVLQMMGRAGRPQFDNQGVAVILVHDPKKSYYKKFLYEPFPVESSLHKKLHDHFNAEVVAGTISNQQDALDYLTWTYFYRRLSMNPTYYDLEETDPDAVSHYLSALVNSTLKALEDGGCVSMDSEAGTVEPTALGRVASTYYLHYTTAALFSARLGPDTALSELLKVLCEAAEYDELPVRHNEELLNDKLSRTVPLPVDHRRLDDPHVKALLLLQAHFSRVALPSTDYATDTKSVLDQSIRVLQAMVDVSASAGWLLTTIGVMRILQMVMQALWDTDSPLLMLPYSSPPVVAALERAALGTLPKLLMAPPRQVEQVLQQSLSQTQTMQVLAVLARLPRVSLIWKVLAKDNSEGTDIVEVQLIRQRGSGGSREDRLKVYSPFYPKRKEEGWWLVVGAPQGQELLALKRVSFVDRLTTRLKVRKEEHQELHLYLIADSYLGLDQEHIIKQAGAWVQSTGFRQGFCSSSLPTKQPKGIANRGHKDSGPRSANPAPLQQHASSSGSQPVQQGGHKGGGSRQQPVGVQGSQHQAQGSDGVAEGQPMQQAESSEGEDAFFDAPEDALE